MSGLVVRRFRDRRSGVEVEAVRVDGPAEAIALRSSTWLEPGQAALLTFPTADPALFIGMQPPLSVYGAQVRHGEYVVKGEAGDVETETVATMAAKYEELEAA
jgi:hypothetical protein